MRERIHSASLAPEAVAAAAAAAAPGTLAFFAVDCAAAPASAPSLVHVCVMSSHPRIPQLSAIRRALSLPSSASRFYPSRLHSPQLERLGSPSPPKEPLRGELTLVPIERNRWLPSEARHHPDAQSMGGLRGRAHRTRRTLHTRLISVRSRSSPAPAPAPAPARRHKHRRRGVENAASAWPAVPRAAEPPVAYQSPAPSRESCLCVPTTLTLPTAPCGEP